MEEEESSLGVVGCFYFEMVLDVARFESTSLIFLLSMSLFHTRVARAYRVFRSCEMVRPCVCGWWSIVTIKWTVPLKVTSLSLSSRFNSAGCNNKLTFTPRLIADNWYIYIYITTTETIEKVVVRCRLICMTLGATAGRHRDEEELIVSRRDWKAQSIIFLYNLPEW